MHNPSQQFPLTGDERAGVSARDIVDFTAASLAWAGKGARVLAGAAAAALDATLHPDAVLVLLDDPRGNETTAAVDGRMRERADFSAEQWRGFLAPWLQPQAAARQVHVVAHPLQPGKLKLLVARIGAERPRGYVALVSSDHGFPRERDNLLLEVATHQLHVALEREDDETRKPMPSASRAPPAQQLMADAIPALIAYVDREHVYRFANRCFHDWFGVDPDAVVGRPVSEVLGAEAYASLRPFIERVLAGEQTTYETCLPYRRGDPRYVYGTYIPDRGPDGNVRGFFALVQDISERKHSEAALSGALALERRTRAEAELLRNLGVALNAELDVQATLQRVVGAATAVAEAELGVFFERGSDDTSERVALCGVSHEAVARLAAGNTVLWRPSFDNEAVIRCDDVTADARYAEDGALQGAPGHPPIRSYLAVPVCSRSGAVIGSLFVAHSQPGRFEARHERLVLAIAAQAAVAIDNARLFDTVREQAERLKITHEQAALGIAEADLDGRFQAVNDRFCQIVGYTREELVGRYFKDVTHADDRATEIEKFRALIAREVDSYQHELRCLRKDGGVVWARLSVSLVRDAGGVPRYGVGLLEDITARRHAEEHNRLLAEASKRLAASLDYKHSLAFVAELTVPAIADWCAVDLVEPDGSLVRVAAAPVQSEMYERIAHYRRRFPPESARGPYRVLGTGRTELIAQVSEAALAAMTRGPEHREALRELNMSSYLCAPMIARERVFGTVTFVQSVSSRHFDEGDRAFAEELARRMAVAFDNALLFDAAREQAERLQATYDHAPIGIAEVEPDGRFQRVNDRFSAITGYGADELLGLRFVDITHPDDIAASDKLFRDLLAGKTDSYQVEKRYLRKDGEVVWAHVTVSLVRDRDGRPEYGIGAIIDITERRRAHIVIDGQKRALEQMARGEALANILETLVETFDRQSTARGMGHVSLLDKEANVLRPAATGRLPGEWIAAVREVPVGAHMGSCAAAVASGADVFAADIAADPRWENVRALALRLGFRAGWSLCLRASDGQVLGTFGILYHEAREPAAEEARFLELITDTVALAIERHRREEVLQQQAQVLRRVHDAVVMVDMGGRILQWNEGARRLFGFAPDEALGRQLASLCVQPDDYAWLEEHVLAPVRRNGRFERVLPLRRRSGDLLHAHVSISLLYDTREQPNAMVAYILDVSERVEAERELAARVRQQEAVARLGQAALSNIDAEALMDQAVRLVAETLGIELCKVLELLPQGDALRLRAGLGWHEGLVGRGTVGAGLDSQAGLTLSAKEPVVVTDLRAETRSSGRPLLHDHGVVCGISMVIQGDTERPYGVLGAHTRRARRFSAYDVNFLESIAHILTTAIQRKRLEQAMQQARDELERRVEERTAELARTNQSLRDEVVERMGVENALRESEAQYRMLFERNPVPAWVFDIHTRSILAANETAMWQYGYTREEFLRMNIHDLHPPEEASRALDYAEQFPPETAYIGVWKHRKQDETVIDVEMFVYEVLFQGRWARLMLANDITERRRAEQEFRVLETITRAVSEARDLDAALYAILRHICETTGWALGEAWLPGVKEDELRCSPAWYYAADGLEEFRHAAWEMQVRNGEGVIGRAWATGQPVWVPDVSEDAAFQRTAEARAARLRAGIAFPVLAEGEVVALFAFFLREPRLEDEHQVKLVTTVATQAGIAIQRKRAEERLRESEERFRLLVEGAHDYAIYMLDVNGCVASWNRGAERLKGYTAEEIIGKPVATFYTAEDVARGLPQEVLARAAVEGVYEGEGWRVRKSGERFWANITTTAWRTADGALRGFVKVTRDATERKRAEEKLRESEARLARAQEFSLLMVAHVGLDGRWLKVPQMLCATLAFREQELLASHFQEVTHPDDIAAEWEQCECLIRGEAKSFDLEKRFLRRDGKVIWVYQNTSIVLDAEDRPLHFLAFIRDITQRKEAEEQLRRSEIQLSEAQRLAHLGSWEWDIASGRVEWSDELYSIYGVAPGTPITFTTYLSCLHPEDRERANYTISAALESREPFTMEERIARPDGELRYLLSHGAVVSGPKGEVERMVGVCLDITERKRAEQRLHEYAHRLESLSQRLLEAQETERRRIARELHDQIGQDLSVIKINLQALQRLPGASALGAHLEETVRIVEGVLATARNLSVELRPSMLDDLGLAAALRWYLDRQVQRAGVALHFVVDNFESRLDSTIETACFRLAQEALTNILRHAHARHVHVTLTAAGEELEMRIRDDGTGFDVEAARVRASRGESFGVLGMEERALLAGGRLEIHSAPGEGTTVVARFPLILKTVHTA